jgi:hypothetical protein
VDKEQGNNKTADGKEEGDEDQGEPAAHAVKSEIRYQTEDKKTPAAMREAATFFNPVPGVRGTPVRS